MFQNTLSQGVVSRFAGSQTPFRWSFLNRQKGFRRRLKKVSALGENVFGECRKPNDYPLLGAVTK